MFQTTAKQHIRNTFLAGTFAVIPLAITAFIIYYVEVHTLDITKYLFGRYIPVVGVLIVLMVIYLAGMIVTSVIGRYFIRMIDMSLVRLPLLKELYSAWKQVSFTPGGGEGMYAKVVLIPSGNGKLFLMGFTSGQTASKGSTLVPVFVPNSPNPIMGRLYLVDQKDVRETPLSADEAFKILLSSGNYIPPEIDPEPKEIPVEPTGP